MNQGIRITTSINIYIFFILENFQSVQNSGMPLVIILGKVELFHPPKRLPCEQAIGAGLVAPPGGPMYLQRARHPIQPSIQAIAVLHHVFHVIHSISKENPDENQEFRHRSRQLAAS